jgi:hypothetical protein
MALQLYNPDREVIDGWNSKLAMSSHQLSDFVPFVNLIALHKSSDLGDFPNRTEWNAYKNSLYTVLLRNDNSGALGTGSYIALKGATLANIQSQMSSFKKEGGVGISSLDVERGAKEAFNVRYTMKMDITNPDIMNEQKKYANLIRLNTFFLILYGWSSSNDNIFQNAPKLPSNPETGTSLNIDLKEDNGGFWKAALVQLYKFDFSFEQNGHLAATLNFMSPNNSTLIHQRTTNISQSMKKKLGLGTSQAGLNKAKSLIVKRIDGHLPTVPDQSADKIPDNVEIKVTTTKFVRPPPAVDSEIVGKPTQEQAKVVQPKGTSKPKEKVAYLYLGWVLEALSQSVANFQNSGNNETAITFVYMNIDQPAVRQIFTDKTKQVVTGDDNDTTIDIDFTVKDLTNVFQIPLDRSVVDQLLTNYNAPLLELVRSLISDSTHILPGIQLATRVRDGNIEIFVASIDYDGLILTLDPSIADPDSGIDTSIADGVGDSKMLKVLFGHPNSLCESIDMTAKLDPNAFSTYQLPINTGSSEIDLRSVIRDAGLDSDYEKFYGRITEEGTVPIIGSQSSIIGQFIASNSSYYIRVVESLFKDNVFGRLLGFYTKRTSIVLHGIIGLNSYNLIKVAGMIKGLSGIYNIIQVTEQLNTTSFNTLIEASLLNPFQQRENASSSEPDLPGFLTV